jgi:hypothetical protein
LLTRAFRGVVVPILLAGAIIGCSGPTEVGPLPTPPSGFPIAFAEDECAPWDGAAVAIYLVNTEMEGDTPPVPYVRIAIWRSAADVGGETIQWRGKDESMGVAVRCSEVGRCQRAQSVTLHFRAREPNGAIPGTLELQFEDGAPIHGGFRATWRQGRVFCW